MKTEYILLDTDPVLHRLYECRNCGSVVSSTVLHDEWHLRQRETDGLAGMNRLIGGGLG